jgi:hypothetical protein
MEENTIYLKSMNHYNYRHDRENPRIIGFVRYTPKGFYSRPCFKVEYESDGKIDYIALRSVLDGEWKMML